jgi:valacyclovir hydrolase
MLGWSAGGISAMIAAAKYPEHIDKLVIWGACAYIKDHDAKIYESKFYPSSTER